MRRTFPYRMPTPLLSLVIQILGTFVLWLFYLPIASQAHAVAPITPSGLNTQINLLQTPPAGKTQYDITGGTRPGGGTNLFHGFGDFSIPADNIANFVNDSGLATSNILGRVTGGNISTISGSIHTTGFGHANLFLMNPAGFLFGPNASINVGGIMTFTSADYMKLTGGTRFNAISNAATDALLTTSPVAAFGFLSSNPGAITVQGSQFTVAEKTGISLVGGDITIQSGTLDDGTIQPARLIVPGGQTNLASVATTGEVSMSSGDGQPPHLTMDGLTTLGNISLLQGASIDSSGNIAGSIFILGGQLVMDASSIQAIAQGTFGDANSTTDIPTTIAITADTVVLSNGTHITASTEGKAPAGDITFNVGTLKAQPGSKSVPLNEFQLTGNLLASDSRSLESNAGYAGTITIQGLNGPGSAAKTISLDSSTISTRVFGGTAEIRPSAISLTADSVEFSNTASILGPFQRNPAATLVTTSLGSAPAGNIVFNVNSLRVNVNPNGTPMMSAKRVFLNSPSGSPDSTGGAPGTVTISGIGPESTDPAKLVALYNAQISTATVAGSSGLPPGTITITTDTMTMSGRSSIFSTTLGSAPAGNIVLNVNQLRANVGPDGTLINDGQPQSLLASESLAQNETAGRAGTVTVSGLGPESTDSAELIALNNTDVSTAVKGGTAVTTPASITMTADAIRLTNSPNIHTDTSGGAPAGHMTFNVNNLTADHATQIRSSTTGPGLGGIITLTAGQSATLNNGSVISASSTGTGNAGSISINAGQRLEMRDSSIKTEAKQAGGGNIDIQAIDRVHLVNSTISTSVLDSNGNSGNISIDPNVVALQNSQVLAQAVQGAGGNIVITTPLFLADSNSVVDASSQFGLNGTVTARSNLTVGQGALTSKPIQAHSLLTQRCATLVNNGQTSSFIVAGREQLPSDPGGWLSSPLAFAALSENLDAVLVVAAAPVTMPIAGQDTGTVSLRRLTPAGFLMANFAESEATGCRS